MHQSSSSTPSCSLSSTPSCSLRSQLLPVQRYLPLLLIICRSTVFDTFMLASLTILAIHRYIPLLLISVGHGHQSQSTPVQLSTLSFIRYIPLLLIICRSCVINCQSSTINARFAHNPCQSNDAFHCFSVYDGFKLASLTINSGCQCHGTIHSFIICRSWGVISV